MKIECIHRELGNAASGYEICNYDLELLEELESLSAQDLIYCCEGASSVTIKKQSTDPSGNIIIHIVLDYVEGVDLILDLCDLQVYFDCELKIQLDPKKEQKIIQFMQKYINNQLKK